MDRGYFILADITGFTSFVAGSELEHSQLIISHILNEIVSKFTPRFNLVEIEGDAVFLYAPVEKFSRGEIILEIIESTYFAFRDSKASLRRLTVCDCNACKMTAFLDLKFIINSGEYVLNEVAGKFKPLGNPVNVLHRLSKNKTGELTGWKAYILLTDDSLKDLNLKLTDLFTNVEHYEHLGEVKTYSLNLEEKYYNFNDSRKDIVLPEEADLILEKYFSVSPSVLWEWVNNPIKRSQWLQVTDWNPIERPFGRTGKGATNHCTNSNFIENLLDYRPFNYYTSSIKSEKNFCIKQTGKFEETNDGTKFSWIIKMESNLPPVIRKLYLKIIYKFGLKINKAFNKLYELISIEEKNFRN